MAGDALIARTYEDQIADAFGEDFVSLFKWADERNLTDLVELNYHVFEQSPKLIDPFRIYAELTLPCGAEILSGWSDEVIAQRLHQFYLELKSAPHIRMEYGNISRHSSARAARAEVKDLVSSGYLLALSLHQPFSLNNKDTTIYYQTMLRLWFIVHGFIRMESHAAHDSVLSFATRYTIFELNDQERMNVIEFFIEQLHIELGDKEHSFEVCNYVIASTANRILRVEGDHLKQNQKQFLNRLARVARLDVELTPINGLGQTGDPISFIYSQPIKKTIQPDFSLALNDIKFEELPSLEAAESSHDDDNTLLGVGISPSETDGEQVLAGTGVYIQRAEQAHFCAWGWDKILPVEVQLLEEWIEDGLHSNSLEHALAAAIIWIAKGFGRSLDTVLGLGIGIEVSNEWTLTSDYTAIQRLPIRRHSAWKPTHASKEWVSPLGERIEVKLPAQVTDCLVAASQSIQPKKLSSLWHAHSQTTLFKWFNAYKPERLERVTSSMLASFLGQSIFDQAGDTALARLLSSYANNALPAACGYGTWDIAAIEKGQELTSKARQRADSSLIGSMLLPVESLLVKAIKEQTDKVRNSKTVIELHNNLVYYVAQALYAATGARYLVYPFESLEYFYISNAKEAFVSFVFINDKDDDIHSGRLVPLCPSAVKHLLNYLDHLECLAQLLKEPFPELAAHITKTSQGTTKELPLFFTLDDNLQWHSLSVKHFDEAQLMNWPLPPNLFRHRFAQVLSSLQVPSDILEGWMGHGERGVACYGDYSPRCWLDDAKHFMDELEASFSSLNFQLITVSLDTLPLSGSKPRWQQRKGKVFGAAKREVQKIKTIETIKEITQDKINQYLGSRRWDDIEPNEFEAFMLTLITDNKSIALSYPLERIAVLYSSLTEAGSHYAHFAKNRYVRLKQERSYLKKEAATALGLFAQMQDWSQKTKRKLFASALSKAQCAQLATIIFSIEKQISYASMLKEIAEGENCVVVQFDKEIFLRYSEELDLEDWSAPAQHHRIDYKTASFFDHSNQSGRKLNVSNKLTHGALEELRLLLALDATSTFYDLIDSVCRVIEQANLIVLPGIVAAGLSERQPPTSLSFQDIARIQKNQSLLPPQVKEQETAQPTVGLVPISVRWHSESSEMLREEAGRFHKDITTTINAYQKSKYKETAKEIHKHCKRYVDKVSSAVLSVGYWIAHVVVIGKYSGRRKTPVPLAKGTVATYYSTLMNVFQDLAYEIDLFSLSEVEITALYQNMLLTKKDKESDVEYFGKRLQMFHRYYVKQGLPEIDWNELDFKSRRRGVLTGVITECDYLKCLEAIRYHYADKTSATMLQFILLLCFRFGLRVGEATRLLRKDWATNKNDTWILVRNNKYRQLKSAQSSRRAVPLLFELVEAEHTVIRDVLNRYETIAGNDTNYLLLSEIKEGSIQLSNLCYQASRELIAIIREVTGNQHLVLHSARHAFYNQLAAVLFGIDTAITKRMKSHLDEEKIISMILGPQNNINRRSSMALCILMGHSHPSVGLKSYNHLISEWADQLTPAVSSRVYRLETVVQMNDWQKWKRKKLDKKRIIDYSTPNLQSLTALLRLVGLGRTFKQAALSLDLSPEHGEKLQGLFATVANGESKEQEKADTLYSARHFLSHIPESAWLRLQSHITKELLVKLNQPITLSELPLLIGMRRQILMATAEHYEFIKCFIDYFEIPTHSYRVQPYKGSPIAYANLSEYGLVDALDKSGKQIDIMQWTMADQSIGPHRNYTAFWLNDRVTCTLRNSYEVVLMVLLIGYMQAL
ncbi:tyrosine-type recombinase/integrase [Aliidiomarina quisquiliarum]|uniref:tyrosine-type recombinase/integrase n=1 Tax=Aliidiomarina quisquiliarum TaxID=2938947 RepID=UPI00208FDD85|nr:tyrosine-type recombinase/integrase [Aliidiomarina quisquiliarum]MCO4320692.1 tyrosine-type recombinase/integrase [Aliidiomarina quisquiliarum]